MPSYEILHYYRDQPFTWVADCGWVDMGVAEGVEEGVRRSEDERVILCSDTLGVEN